MKKIISGVILFVIILSSFNNSLAYNLDSVYKKIDVIYEKSPEKLEKLNEKILKLLGEKISDKSKEILISIYSYIKNKTDIKSSNDLKVIVISDKRCGNKCYVEETINQLKEIPTLSNNDFIIQDFSDSGVKEFLKINGINKLPAVIFSDNLTVTELTSYLQPTSDNNYSLALGSTYNPFLERSDKGFLVLDKDILKHFKAYSYIQGVSDAKITWLEYSDLECPFCSRQYTDGTVKEIQKIYQNKLNLIFKHFPLDFHKNARTGALITECLAEQKGKDAFYSLIEKAYSDGKSEKSFLISESVKLGADKTKLEKCVNEGKYLSKIEDIQKNGAEIFGITGTPGNVLINNETGEYEIISGAYPSSYFKEVIDKLLK